PDHGSSHDIWSDMSKLALIDVLRQLPTANICHQFGSLLFAAVMRRIISMPVIWVMPAGGSTEPTSTSDPVLRSQAKLRFAVPSHAPQRSATPVACAGGARGSAHRSESHTMRGAMRFKRGLRELRQAGADASRDMAGAVRVCRAAATGASGGRGESLIG